MEGPERPWATTTVRGDVMGGLCLQRGNDQIQQLGNLLEDFSGRGFAQFDSRNRPVSDHRSRCSV